MSCVPFTNEKDDVVLQALEGLGLAHPQGLMLNSKHRYIKRRTPPKNKVGLVSGGGSGHEPLHAGFVGEGMLDVAVCGAIFASPTALQVVEATRAADSGAGVVQIVKNYTGDVLNFRIAGELAGDTDIETEMVLVDDDLATDTDEDSPGRRGTGATLFVEKICGAAAERGDSLHEVAEIGRRVAREARSMAFALSAPTHPGADKPQFELGENEVEMGVGIHGERGTSRVPFASADELMNQLIDPLVEALGLCKGSRVIALVNGMGGTYPLELQIATRAVHHRLGESGIQIERTLTGSYITSLDMHGVSLTLLPVDEELLELWDAPVRTPALTW